MTTKKIALLVAGALVGLGLLLVAPWPDADESRIVSAVAIARPPQVVYAFVTTPENWPKWHPASRAVSGAVDHSLATGEKVTEDVVIAGRPGRVVWTVTKRDAPAQWAIAGDIDGRDTSPGPAQPFA